jgi:hypothetical protein
MQRTLRMDAVARRAAVLLAGAAVRSLAAAGRAQLRGEVASGPPPEVG